MKTLTIRLPNTLITEIENESRLRGVSKSDVVRERLAGAPVASKSHPLADIFAEMDYSPSSAPQRNGAEDKKRLPEIIRTHHRAAKRHFRQ